MPYNKFNNRCQRPYSRNNGTNGFNSFHLNSIKKVWGNVLSRWWTILILGPCGGKPFCTVLVDAVLSG